MISLIEFNQDLIILRKEAELLGLSYEENPRIGRQNDKLHIMASYDYYYDECLKHDDKYYKDQKALDSDQPVENYYLYEKCVNAHDYVHIKKSSHLVNLLSFAPICKHKFFVKESVVSSEASVDNIDMILHRMEQKAKQLEEVVDSIRKNTFNQRTNVHVGGGLIATYNDLTLKEDVCTDVLQTELNNGWRIIAVCVQPDQRRPDYILGRYNPKLEVAEKENAGR